MIPDSLPCIACGLSVKLVHENGHFQWTNDGIWMLETGNYGSTMLDDPPEHLAAFMVLCDGCLGSRRNRLKAIDLSAGVGTDHWKWLDEMPEWLLRGSGNLISDPIMRSFKCFECGMGATGPGATGASCGSHGPMIEIPA